MRWKLLILTSLVAAIFAFAVWCAFTIGLYGSARAMARSDVRLFGSALAPVAMAVAAAVFVYRHTSKRRKLQAVLCGVLTLSLAADAYFLAWAFAPDRFYIPKTYEVRYAP